jgi:hypothetical protein
VDECKPLPPTRSMLPLAVALGPAAAPAPAPAAVAIAAPAPAAAATADERAEILRVWVRFERMSVSRLVDRLTLTACEVLVDRFGDARSGRV